MLSVTRQKSIYRYTYIYSTLVYIYTRLHGFSICSDRLNTIVVRASVYNDNNNDNNGVSDHNNNVEKKPAPRTLEQKIDGSIVHVGA